MSDDLVGRYRRAYPRIWRHPGFQKLTQAEQRLALYILTGPQMNRIGLAHFSLATAAEDLSLGSDTLRRGLANVSATFGWMFDAESRVIYIPSWWRWNRPDNLNVLRGNLKDVSEIPPCGLLDAFAANLTYLPSDVHETFIEGLRLRLGKRPPTQEQEQYQEQEQGAGTVPREPANSRRRTVPFGADKRQSSTEEHLKVARRVLELTSSNASLDHLLDLFREVHREAYPDARYTKTQATQAVSTALAEIRASGVRA